MPSDELEKRIQVLEDIEAIKRLKHRYCGFCDNQYDADALADLFVEDAVWDGKERGRNEGREAIRAFFQNAPRRLPFAIHMVLNPIIDVTGDRLPGYGTCSSPARMPRVTRPYGAQLVTMKNMCGSTASGSSRT